MAHLIHSRNAAERHIAAAEQRARTLARLATASTRADNWLAGLALLLALAGICR